MHPLDVHENDYVKTASKFGWLSPALKFGWNSLLTYLFLPEIGSALRSFGIRDRWVFSNPMPGTNTAYRMKELGSGMQHPLSTDPGLMKQLLNK